MIGTFILSRLSDNLKTFSKKQKVAYFASTITLFFIAVLIEPKEIGNWYDPPIIVADLILAMVVAGIIYLFMLWYNNKTAKK